VITVDGFLTKDMWNAFRAHCDTLSYAGVINPKDGVLYPGISLDIPEAVRAAVVRRIGALTDCEPRNITMFLRLSPKGTPAPHGAHTDTIMGKYSLMLYMNRAEHCRGGTEMCAHKRTGLDTDPTTDEELAAWQRDTNVATAWQGYYTCNMRSNRALIFEANKMHRALPIGGFGFTEKDARLVLTAFWE
jgi:hypothetical protein